MAYYRICPDCGAYLDPGEKCDCREVKERIRKREETEMKRLLREEKNGQLRMAV